LKFANLRAKLLLFTQIAKQIQNLSTMIAEIIANTPPNPAEIPLHKGKVKG